MNDFKSITVTREGDNEVEVVHNPTPFPLVGRGKHGAVFKISSDQCVKIYVKQKNILKESEALKATQDSPIVPKLYEVGENYVVMEYIEGPTLEQYLEAKGIITEGITSKILSLIQEMKRLNFARLDPRLRNILVTNQEELKIIDLVHSFKTKKDRPDRPEYLMADLKNLGILSSFLDQVKHLDPESYQEWKDFI
ncbi:RIO-like serine/threonine protein kinase [Neobacillus niacini]|uniref:protein kinase domain-containing protein n=1 Tax=Neobacillus niacini TaxID=86668 RepID=UPI00285E5E4B|nr:RIO1 family regulatory kinase/ATPase [Neobacillus niacini]MDR7080250.1 RIO-like serine/threonine protein kinase [Neobacillus niacini]